MAREALGKGLESLFVVRPGAEGEGEEVVITASIDRVYPDEDQHRKTFHDDTLKELADSIRVHGVLQPLLVRKFGAGYQIIAGERRYRAAKMVGLTELPVIVKDFDEKKAREAALIENLQREDLNPMDEAMGYDALMRNFNLTQDQAARQIGKSRAAVANAVRLLNLPASAQSLLRQGVITAGHARALLPLKDEGAIQDMLIRIVDRDMTVRQVEDEVRDLTEGGRTPRKTDKKAARSEVLQAQLKKVAKKAGTALGRRVTIRSTPAGKGKITLEYENDRDLEGLLETLCGPDFTLDL